MTRGNVDFVQVLVSMTIETGGVAALLRMDRARLFGPNRSASEWLQATREAAVLGAFLFGWLYGGPALVVHFVKSRRYTGNAFAGLLLGVLLALDLVAADVGAQLGAAAAIEWLGL